MIELARRYAAAYFELDRNEQRFVDTARTVMGLTSLYEVLTSPVIDRSEKVRVLKRLPFLNDTPLLLHFYEQLVRKGRVTLLPNIVTAYQELALEAENTAVCVMRCVHAPDSARQEAIKTALCKLHHRDKVLLAIRLEPELLGGFVLEIDGVTYDRSIRGRLREMAALLEEGEGHVRNIG